ncbi:MAG: exosome complex RNA-binding protein Csl4 [Candidatus Bathyarchaeia archaeon]
MRDSKRHGQFVSPGDKLGVIEEFVPGVGTYVMQNTIYSQLTGQVVLNIESREIRVTPKTKSPTIPRKGIIVVGEVLQTQDKVASVRIFKIGETYLNKPFNAILHISYASRYFTKSLQSAFRPGDIVRAMVLGDENLPYQLTTSDADLGVLQAFCSRCGAPLNLNRRQLVCSRCGNTEYRKISERYGKDA